MDKRELATVLAALRHYQYPRTSTASGLLDIATDGGTFHPLSDAEIDALCERLNVPDTITPPTKADPIRAVVETMARFVPYAWTESEGYDDEQRGDAISTMNDMIASARDALGLPPTPANEVGEQEEGE